MALPLLVHLFSRRPPAPAARRFPAARFVQQAVAVTTRRRPRRLLLALRITVLLALVLAFMQPIWRGGISNFEPRILDLEAQQTGELSEELTGVHVGIVLDRTASMRRAAAGESLFDRARHQAIDLLGSLDPAHDRASVILLDRSPRPLLAEPTADFAWLIDEVAQLAPTQEHGQLSAALHQLRVVHDRLAAPAPPLHVHVFTDAQQSQMLSRSAAALPAAHWQWHIHAGDAANLALARVRTWPSEPIAQQPATVTAELSNHSNRPRVVAVSLRVASQPLATRRVFLDPFEQAVVSFDVTFHQPGFAVVELGLDDAHTDALPQDDIVGRVACVHAAQRVHLITQSDVNDPAAAAYFLARAIQPTAGSDTAHHVALQVHPPAALPALAAEVNAAREGAPPAVFVLVEAGRLDEAALDALTALVRLEQGLLWILDSGPAAAALSDWAARHDPPLTPLLPDAALPWQDAPPRSVTLEGGRFDDDVLAVFEGPARTALLRSAFGQHLRSRPAPGARVLLHFSDHTPALAMTRAGGSRVAVWAGALSPPQSDFVRTAMFVPWTHQLLRHLAPGLPQIGSPHPGQRVELRVPAAAQDAELLDPVGRTWTEDHVAHPGLYALRDRASGALRSGVWVELDPAESDLRAADDATLDAMAQASRAAAASTVHRAASHRAVPPTDVAPDAFALWAWGVMLAVGALALEAGVLLAVGRRAGEAAHAV